MKQEQPVPPEPQTINQFCGLDESAFQCYLEQKNAFIENLDQKAEARIADALEKRLSWVA